MKTRFWFKCTTLIRYSSSQHHNLKTKQQNFMMITIQWPEIWERYCTKILEKKRRKGRAKTAITLLSTQAEYQNFSLGMHMMYELSNKSQNSIETKSSNNNQDKGSNIRTKPDNKKLNKASTGHANSLFKARNLLLTFNLWTNTKWVSDFPHWTCKGNDRHKNDSFDAKKMSKATWDSQIRIHAWKA